jgi:hypothetical protein
MNFSSSLRGLGLAVAAALPLAAGCASSRIEASDARGTNTGTYPNLNVAPSVATAQYTPYSLAQQEARLASARQDQKAQTTFAEATIDRSRDDAERLKVLRKQHGESTLNAIESASSAAPAPETN